MHLDGCCNFFDPTGQRLWLLKWPNIIFSTICIPHVPPLKTLVFGYQMPIQSIACDSFYKTIP